jgi:RNA polymerase sigma-70 factor (ECF subfamily)
MCGRASQRGERDEVGRMKNVPVNPLDLELRRMRFRTLALPHLDRLVALASRWSAGQEAEDCVQETYVRAWVSFDQLRDPGAALPWLCQILRKVAGERRRALGWWQEPVPVGDLEEAHEEIIASEDPSLFERLLEGLDPARLQEALRSIPEEFAEPVELHDVHGLKYGEIAAVTAQPVGTVMSRVSRGRRMLAGFVALLGDGVSRGAA